MKTVETVILPEDTKNAGWITNELKPCPFCGCSNILTAGTKNTTTGNIVYKAFCTNWECGAMVHSCLGGDDKAKESRNAVVTKWNTRP
jgi:Lar family restriction alleviation protein